MTEQQHTTMTREQEYDFYSREENQIPQGPARRRRRSPLADPVAVRLPPGLLEAARQAAAADDRPLSSWIRRAVEHELDDRPATVAGPAGDVTAPR